MRLLSESDLDIDDTKASKQRNWWRQLTRIRRAGHCDDLPN